MSKLLFSTCIAAAVLCGCRQSKVTISGKLLGPNSQTAYLEQVSALNQTIIDSVALADDGSYRFTLNDVAQTPSIYNIVYGGERIPLLLKSGDRLTVNSIGNPLQNYTVAGSEESELLHEFNSTYIANLQQLELVSAKLIQSDDKDKDELKRQYLKQYRKLKSNQISFIIEHKDKIAAVYALYQRLPGEQHLYSASNDNIYFRTVADAVSESYPESPYLPTLRNEVARMEARNNLLQSIKESSYPDIEVPDMFGNKIKLSSLDGYVVLLDFWSAEMGNSNALNADLKEIFRKYESKGFRVYQVGIDTSKTAWVSAVQEQALPWISVCDYLGQKSPIVGIYNIRKVPSNYLIDRNGNIVGKDLYSNALEKQLDELLN